MRGSFVWARFLLEGFLLYGLHNPPAVGAFLDAAGHSLEVGGTVIVGGAGPRWNSVLDCFPGLIGKEQ